MNSPMRPFDVGDHFSVLFSSLRENIGLLALIAALATVVVLTTNIVFGAASIVSGFAGLVVYVIAGPVAIMAVFDSQAGREVRGRDYLNIAISMSIPIFFLSIAQAIFISIGMLLLIFPGLYVAAMLYVIIPAVVIERSGFAGFNRSLQLTEGYRMSILLVVLCVFLLCAAFFFVGGIITFFLSSIPFVGSALGGFISNFIYLIPPVSSALVYWRLVERKEGRGITDIADVFA